MSYKIVIDSCGELPAAYKEDARFESVPLTLIVNDEEIIDDGRISDTADRVTMTFGVIELPEESGQITDEFEPVGEVFELELQ